MKQRKLLSLLFASSLLAVATAHAVATRSFVIDDSAAFLAGELDHASVLADGSLRPGPATERVGVDDVQIAWSLARTTDGTAYVGTATEGRILRVRGTEVTALAETHQLAVTSLAIVGNKLYAGTMPEARIYEIDLASSAMRELVKLPDTEHIWALAHDHHRNALIAGTGPQGRIFSITFAGVATVLHDNETAHILSLALDDAGTLYAGTSDRALVLRVPTQGATTVFWDFPGTEINALAYRNGVLAVAANEFTEAPAAASTGTTSTTPAVTTSTSRATRPRSGKGKLFSITVDGQLEQLASQDDAHFTSLAYARDGQLWAAIAKDGRVLRIAADHGTSTILDVKERQIVAMILDDAPLALASDGVALYRISASNASQAQWTSKVLDADFNSRFGALSWRGRGALELRSRSGNTAVPDDTWSAWSNPINAPTDIPSPGARYLQLRVTFGASDTVLHALTAYYVPQNQRAVVRDLNATTRRPTKRETPAASGGASSENASASEETPTATTNMRVTWRVDNPDGDRMRYRVDVRGEAQTTWRTITRESETLTRPEATWDTQGFADGYYRVRVRATDELSNPANRALESITESSPILVDNHAPQIEDLRIASDVLTANVRDSFSAVAKLEIARDGEEWRPLEAADGLCDELTENVRHSLTRENGTHVFAIRATDAAGNTSIAEIETTFAATR